MALVLATKVGTGCNRRPAHHSYAINLQQTTHIGRLYTILNSHISCLNIFMMTPNKDYYPFVDCVLSSAFFDYGE